MLNRIIFLVSACGMPFVGSAVEGVREVQGQLVVASLKVMQMQVAIERDREEALWKDRIRALNSGVLQGQEAVKQIQKEVLKAWQVAEDQSIEYSKIVDPILGLSRHEQAPLYSYDEFFEKERAKYKALLATKQDYGASVLLQEKVNKLREILDESGEDHPELMLSDSTLRLEDGVYDITGREFMGLVQSSIEGHLLHEEEIKKALLDVVQHAESWKKYSLKAIAVLCPEKERERC